MPTLLPPSNHLFNLLHVHPVWHEGEDSWVQPNWLQLWDPAGWGICVPHGQKGVELLPAAPPAQEHSVANTDSTAQEHSSTFISNMLPKERWKKKIFILLFTLCSLKIHTIAPSLKINHIQN